MVQWLFASQFGRWKSTDWTGINNNNRALFYYLQMQHNILFNMTERSFFLETVIEVKKVIYISKSNCTVLCSRSIYPFFASQLESRYQSSIISIFYCFFLLIFTYISVAVSLSFSNNVLLSYLFKYFLLKFCTFLTHFLLIFWFYILACTQHW